MSYFGKYARTPKAFEWCGMQVWLLKLTQADHEAVFDTDLSPPADQGEDRKRTKNFHLDLLARCLCDEQGQLVDAADIEHLRAQVAFDDVVALGKIAMKHSGYPDPDADEKKS